MEQGLVEGVGHGLVVGPELVAEQGLHGCWTRAGYQARPSCGTRAGGGGRAGLWGQSWLCRDL